MSFTYIRLTGLGHYVEHDQYDGDSRAFLDSVRTRTIAGRGGETRAIAPVNGPGMPSCEHAPRQCNLLSILY